MTTDVNVHSAKPQEMKWRSDKWSKASIIHNTKSPPIRL